MANLNVDRRSFLHALGLGTAHVLFSGSLYSCGSKAKSADPLQMVTLGNSGLKTTLLGMGTGVSGYMRSAFLTRQDKQKSLGVLQHAYDRGIRNIDCADAYGTHGIMKEALRKMNRDELTLTTKIWTRRGGIPEGEERRDMNKIVDRFRKELGTDYIDLVQIHCMVDEDWTETMKPQMDMLEKLKAKGVIKAHGVSVHTHEAMKAAVNHPWVDVLHARINPYGIAMDLPDPKEVIEVINQLHANGKGVIGMKLVGNGKLRKQSDKMDASLRFVLGLDCVDMVIVGFEDVGQIDNYLDRMKKALAHI